MRVAGRAANRRRAAALATVLGVCAAFGAARAADLQRDRDWAPPPAPRVLPLVPIDPDPGPASSSGYYGYYGFDIGGTPYGGLYSASPVCLRSIPTPRGYRTVDVCRPD